MEEIDELRAKVIASMSASSNPKSKLKNESTKTREEGELSSSDDDEIPKCSTAPPTSTTAPLIQSTAVSQGNKSARSSKLGDTAFGNDPSSSGDIPCQKLVKSSYHKRYKMVPVPPKPVNHRASAWHLPPGPNNNLVISFSDDDSGSDPEQAERSSERKGNTLGVDHCKRPAAPFRPKPGILRRTASNKMKLIPKKSSLSRTFISSMTKTHGANSINSGPSSVDQGSRVRNFDPLNRTSAGRGSGYNPGVELNSSKLENLRQQIAMRENELKHQRKSVQQNMETVLGSYHNHNDPRAIDNNKTRKVRSTSADFVQIAPNEDSKRLKLDSATRSVSDLKMPVLENLCNRDRNLMSCSQCNEEVPVGVTEAKEQQFPALSENILTEVKNGTRICTSCSQSDKSAKPIHSSMLSQSATTSKLAFRADDGSACQLKVPSPRKSNIEEFNPSTFGAHYSSDCFLNKAPSMHNLSRASGCSEVTAGDGTLKPASDSMFNMCSIHAPDGKLPISDTTVKNARFFNCPDQLKITGHKSMDIESLMKIEALQDKELEEAQEHRRRCEIEERNALKAYREAQMALVEANAKCTYLYQKRELYSAQLRAFAMENSSSLWSSKWNMETGVGLNSLNNVPEDNVNLLPGLRLDGQMQPEFEALNEQLGYGSKIPCISDAILNTSSRHITGQNLGSEPCSEPDGSTSELLRNRDNGTANGGCTPPNCPNMSADEDEETYPFVHKGDHSGVVCKNKEGREMGINYGPKGRSSTDNSQDSVLLEASLRSELFARLGEKNLLKNSGQGYGTEYRAEKVAESDVKNGEKRMSIGNLEHMAMEQSQVYDIRGTDKLEKRDSTEVHDQCHNKNNSFCFAPLDIAYHENGNSSFREAYGSSVCVSSLPDSALRSTFGLVKVTTPIMATGFQTGNQQTLVSDVYNKEDVDLSYGEISLRFMGLNSTEDGKRDVSLGEFGSYSCDHLVDPFWPLCMYELRGKCNNEECIWQHVKDYSQGDSKQDDDFARADHQVQFQNLERYVAQKLSMYLDCYIITAPPKYIAGSCILKADLHSCEFSVVPFSPQRNLLSDRPFSHGNDGCIEVSGSWNKRSLYFQNQESVEKQLKQNLADSEQSLDIALNFFNQEFNILEGKKKALPVLSRALEADRASVVLWIVYLHIYYRNEKTVGKDDMFFHAIQQNQGSYELWLMYIDSRREIDDQLLAYDSALSALCCNASAPERDIVHSSACILDLFLQMMDCFCMSGNVMKALTRIHGLFPAVTDSNDPCSPFLPNILSCLTLSDKCIFWVCCVYLLIYKKVPESIVHQFEYDKELSLLEWPPIQSSADERQHAVELMEMAVDSVASCNSDVFEGQTAVRSAQMLALNHVKCIAAVEGLDCSRNLLEKYTKLYPRCLEFVLTSARLQKQGFEVNFAGFEEALSNWPTDVPGIQCIWNQYAEYALENGRVSFAKELMVRWFQSVWQVQNSQNGKSDVVEDDCFYDLPGSPSASNPNACVDSSDQNDHLFRLLNLSLYKLFQNDLVEARLAIDSALKMTACEDFKHCIKEHSLFMLSSRSQLMEDAPVNGILDVLNGYLIYTGCFPVSEPLSRKFLQNIKKPRSRQLISNMLGSISNDCSVVNLVLEAWYGPSLLPRCSKLKDLVDLVEAVMEIFPANYRLAISVCRLITEGSNSTIIPSASVVFWASTILVNSIFQTVPVPPENIWVEAAGILGNVALVEAMSKRFLQRALSVFPFSVKLWKLYFNLHKDTGNTSAVLEAARERGISLD